MKDEDGTSTKHKEHAGTLLSDIQHDACIGFQGGEKKDIKLSEERHVAEIEYRNERCNAPDGGWGWLIVLGATVLQCFTAGIVQSNGVLFEKFQNRFHGSATSTAFVMALAYCVRLMVGPIVSIMTNRYSCRCLTAIGAIIFSSGLIITGYITSQHLLYLSFSLLCGVGRAFILTPVPVILGHYFDKWRSRAFGFSNSGMSIGGFFISPLVEILFRSYGYQGAFLILGGCGFQVLVASALFRPINLHRQFTVKYTKLIAVKQSTNEDLEQDYSGSSESWEDDHYDEDIDQREFFLNQTANTHREGNLELQKKNVTKKHLKTKKTLCMDFSILKDIKFLCFNIATFFMLIPNIPLFLPSSAKEKGLLATEGVFLVSVFSGSNGIASFLSGFIFDCQCIKTIRPQIYSGITLCQSMVVVLFPWMKTFHELCVVSALYGALCGIKVAQKSVVLIDIMGMDNFASSLAITMSVQALGAFIGPTLAGSLIDLFGTYDVSFYLFAAALFIGAVIMAFGQVCHIGTVKRKATQIQRYYRRAPISYRRLTIVPPYSM